MGAAIGERFVPIIPDEARTFGMDSLFPTAKIYSPFGQTYEAVDRNLMLGYKESERGQLLHEGISEAGAMGSVTAAGSAYATHGTHMIPVYVFYSMFGWQRTGDQMWALGDQLGRGFLLGATAGRTTLTGEGLQHNDGHSMLLASVSEACISYDPAWAYEIAVITKDALRRMYDASGEHPDGENIFYYLTVYNEPYPQPAEPSDFPGGTAALEEGILRGLYLYSAAASVAAQDEPAVPGWLGHTSGEAERSGVSSPRAQIVASGVALRQALTAQEMLAAVVKTQRLRCRWVVADEAFGDNPSFLEGVAGLGLWYFTEVAHTTRVWAERPATHIPPWRGRGRRPQRERLVEGAPEARTVLEVAAALPAEAWTRQTIKEGSQGPMVAEFAALRVVAVRDALPSPAVWLVLRRHLETEALKTYLSNAPIDTALETQVRMSGMRWPIEIV